MALATDGREWVDAIGIDPSLVNTTICHIRRYRDEEGVWQAEGGQHVFRKMPTNAKLTSHERALQIMNQTAACLEQLFETRRDNSRVVICCENYSFGSSQGAHQLGEVGLAVRMAVRLATEFVTGKGGAWPVLIEPKRLKKYVANNGNAGKPAMLLNVYKSWDVDTKDDNQADAYGLARIALALAGGEAPGPGFANYRQETIDAVRLEQGKSVSVFLAAGKVN